MMRRTARLVIFLSALHGTYMLQLSLLAQTARQETNGSLNR